MSKRILTGIQSSGTPHLGNYLGSMKPIITLSHSQPAFIMIADLHALTTSKNPAQLRQNIQNVALDFLALGLNTENSVFFRQSDIPAHTELSWILSCISPTGLLERAHAWKDSKNKGLKEPTVGLFTYPALMAADILLYDIDLVPVGKDQKQHIEIARDLAEKFNNLYGETFTLPQPQINDQTSYILGTDGIHKMSKSYGNTIDLFTTPEKLKKQIFSIKTDSLPLEAPKKPETCQIFYLYSFFSTREEQNALKQKYLAGNFGYGQAKQILLDQLSNYFSKARIKRKELSENPNHVNNILAEGAKKASTFANEKLNLVKQKIGLI